MNIVLYTQRVEIVKSYGERRDCADLIDASRSYEANSTAFNASKSMALKGLEIGQ